MKALSDRTHRPTKFIVAGFDGLRPEDVTPESMPALASFAAERHRWTRFLSAFPAESAVTRAALVTGLRPDGHGVVADEFFRPDPRATAPDERIFSGWSIPALLRQDKFSGGLLRAPDLGRRLARDGKTLRVISSESAGSARLQHLRPEGLTGHLACSVHALLQTAPAAEAKALTARSGDGVPLQFPDLRGTRLAGELFLEREAARGAAGLADVTLLRFGDPGHSQRAFGPNDPRTAEARRCADAVFAKILDWWREFGEAENVQLVALSDRGCGEAARAMDLRAALESAGWRTADAAAVRAGTDLTDVDVVIAGAAAPGLWVRDPGAARLAALRDALAAMPDAGLILSQPKAGRAGDATPRDDIEGRVPGTFSEALLSAACDRGPDLRVIPRADAATGRFVTFEDLEPGAGATGGLTAHETRAFLAAAGSRFPGGGVHGEPAGADDLAATMMTMLGLLDDEAETPLPTGRILGEAFGVDRPDAPVVRETLSIGFDGFEQRLTRLICRGRPYVLSGERAADDGWTPEAGLPDPEGAEDDRDA